MSLIVLPPGLRPNTFILRMATVQRAAGSSFGGSEQVRDMMNDRWLISLTLPNRLHADAARVEAFIDALRGMTNTVLLYHFGRKVPQGTMRGSPVMGATAFQMASVIYVQGVPGDTLRAGDMLGVGGLLLRVQNDAAANGAGVLTVPIVNRLRRTIPVGSAITWDRPAVAFRQTSASAAGVQYVPGYATEVSFDFMEDMSS